MKCIKCGKNTKESIDGICHSCYSQNSLLKDYKIMKFKYCFNCKELKFRNKLVKNVDKLIKNYIVFDDYAVIHEINTKIDLDNKKVFAEIIGYFKFDKKNIIREEFSFDIILDELFCNICKKKSSQAFSAIVQLRNTKNKNYDLIKTELIKTLNSVTNIVKFEKLKEGYDFYLTDIDKSYIASKRIIKKYGGIIKVSKKLFSQDKVTSKQVYRVTFLINLFDFSLKDYIFINNSIYKINKIDKSNVVLKHNYSNKSLIKHNSEIKNKIIMPSDFFETVVVAVKPDYFVIDRDYQAIKLISNKEHNIDDKTKVIIKKNVAFEL